MLLKISVKIIKELVIERSYNMIKEMLAEGDIEREDFDQMCEMINNMIWRISSLDSLHEIFHMVDGGSMDVIGYETIDELLQDLQ